MTLHEAWLALRRRWWLVLGLPATVGIVTLVLGPRRPVTVQARASFALAVSPDLVIPTSDAGAAKVGEALIDDISRVIGGDVFAAKVAARVPGGQVAPGEIASSLSATDRHRVVDVTVTRSLAPGAGAAAIEATSAELEAIALAVVDELEDNGSDVFTNLGATGARLTVVDRPDAVVLPPTVRQRVDLPLRLAAALALGVALALIVWVADPRVATPQQAAAAAGAPLLGAVEAGIGSRDSPVEPAAYADQGAPARIARRP